jgi:hypothetical protein
MPDAWPFTHHTQGPHGRRGHGFTGDPSGSVVCPDRSRGAVSGNCRRVRTSAALRCQPPMSCMSHGVPLNGMPAITVLRGSRVHMARAPQEPVLEQYHGDPAGSVVKPDSFKHPVSLFSATLHVHHKLRGRPWPPAGSTVSLSGRPAVLCCIA